MTIELDSTLAQAEVLYLSFSQFVADIDRRKVEEHGNNELRRRGHTSRAPQSTNLNMLNLSDELRNLLKTRR